MREWMMDAWYLRGATTSAALSLSLFLSTGSFVLYVFRHVRCLKLLLSKFSFCY